MLYLTKGYRIQSKNAARCPTFQNQKILRLISELPSEQMILDYGCGKLRYALPLATRAKRVIAVDSDDQLQSPYRIGDRITTIRKEAKRIRKLKIFSLRHKTWKSIRYDSVFCTHVMSAIPSKAARTEILETSFDVLKSGGKLFVINTIKDTYYERQALMKTSIKHLDGFISSRTATPSFFGYVDSIKLKAACKRVGFASVEVRQMGSFYVLTATK